MKNKAPIGKQSGADSGVQEKEGEQISNQRIPQKWETNTRATEESQSAHTDLARRDGSKN
jgi:hypothetical protein